jgi:RNA polymerase, sigma-24 subunit, ECF subfamily
LCVIFAIVATRLPGWFEIKINLEETMALINLKKYYPKFYRKDCILNASEEVADFLEASQKEEAAALRKLRRHSGKVMPIAAGNSCTPETASFGRQPEDAYVQKYFARELHSAVACLPEKQAARIRAHFFQDMPIAEIAKAENVTVQCVWQSIHRGLRNLRQILRDAAEGI